MAPDLLKGGREEDGAVRLVGRAKRRSIQIPIYGFSLNIQFAWNFPKRQTVIFLLHHLCQTLSIHSDITLLWGWGSRMSKYILRIQPFSYIFTCHFGT